MKPGSNSAIKHVGFADLPNAHLKATTIDGAKTAEAAGKASAEDGQPVVLFGADEAGKAHASRFTDADTELVERAAGLMGFKVLKVTTPEMRAAALELPAGRIFGVSGRAFVPFVKMAAYKALCGFEGAYAPAAPAAPDDGASLSFADVPQSWEAISPGSLVLASSGDESGAWYPAVVVHLMADDMLTLRWRDWPDWDAFIRRPNTLALLPATA